MWISRHRRPLSLAAVTVAALTLRLVNIGTEPFWGDEVLSLDVVTHHANVAGMLEYLAAVEFHPPLYYLMLRSWVSAFGTGEAAVRALSVAFSVATVPLLYLVSMRMFHVRAGALVAAAAYAVLPMAVEFGQEGRPYAALTFFGLTALWCAWEWVASRRWQWAAGYAASLLAGMFLHYSFAFLALTLAGWTLWQFMRAAGTKSRFFTWWLAVHGVAFLGFSPWLVPFLYKIDLGNYEFFGKSRNETMMRPTSMLLTTLEQLVWTTKAKLQPNLYGAAKLLAVAGFGWAAIRAAKGTDDGRASARAYLGLLFAAPIVLFFLSPISRPYAPLFARHVMYALLPLCLALGALAARLPFRPAAAIFALGFASVLPYVIETVGDDSVWDPGHRLQMVAEHVNEQYKEGDEVLVWGAFVRTDFNHYLRPELSARSYLPVALFGAEHDLYGSRATLGVLENESQVRIRAVSETEGRAFMEMFVRHESPGRIWLFDFPKEDRTVHRWLAEKGWRQAFTSPGDLFSLDMFVAPVTPESADAAKTTP